MKNSLLIVTKLVIAIALLLALAVGLACGGGGSGLAALEGHWKMTLSDWTHTYPDSVLRVNVAPGPCTITTPLGVYGELMAYCYVADKAGHGSISGNGFFYAPTEVLVESYAKVASLRDSISFGAVWVEGDIQSGNFSIFTSTATLSGEGKMTGTWLCAVGNCMAPTPQGGETIVGGTFVGNTN